MKTVFIGDTELVIVNLERRNEEEILHDVLRKLRKADSVEFKASYMGPSEDIYPATLDGREFSVVFDVDYRAYIQSTSKACLEQVQKLLAD